MILDPPKIKSQLLQVLFLKLHAGLLGVCFIIIGGGWYVWIFSYFMNRGKKHRYKLSSKVNISFNFIISSSQVNIIIDIVQAMALKFHFSLWRRRLYRPSFQTTKSFCRMFGTWCHGQGGFPRCLSGRESACQYSICKRCRFSSWVRKIPWRRAWQCTPVFLPRESHGQRNLLGYSL